MNAFKDEIIAYLISNNIDGRKLLQIPRKEFSARIVEYLNNAKVRGPANKAYDRWKKLNQKTTQNATQVYVLPLIQWNDNTVIHKNSRTINS